MSTLYLKASREQVARCVLFSGDPGRVKQVTALMEDVRLVAVNREFCTYTGHYRGLPITVTSTGIGGPSAAIAMEEMYDCGMEVAVRLGTVMGLSENLGRFLIPRGVMRRDATSRAYVDSAYPAVPDLDLLGCMNESVRNNGRDCENPLMCSLDGFYCQMRESALSRRMGDQVAETIRELKRYQIGGIDMESGVVLTLANLMGIRGCVVTLATVLENLSASIPEEERGGEERLLCKIVLDGVVLWHRKHNGREESA